MLSALALVRWTHGKAGREGTDSTQLTRQYHPFIHTDNQQAALLASWLPPPIPSCLGLLRGSTQGLPPSLPPYLPPGGAGALAGWDKKKRGRINITKAGGGGGGGRGGGGGGKGGSSKKKGTNTSDPSSSTLPLPPPPPSLPNSSSTTSISSSSSTTTTTTPFLVDPARLRALGIDRQMLVDIGLENDESRSNPLYLHMAHQLRRGARKKDPNAPKRPLSAYNLFFRDLKEGLTAAGPTVKKSFEGLGKYVGEEWRKLGEEERGRYERMAEVERKMYHRKMAVYEGREEGEGEGGGGDGGGGGGGGGEGGGGGGEGQGYRRVGCCWSRGMCL